MPLRFALFALLVWPLAAFGGRSAATAVTFGLTCLVLALVVNNRLGGRLGAPLGRRSALLGDRLGGGLDRALCALLALIALQVVPLPASIVGLVSPHVAPVARALSIDGGPPGAWQRLDHQRVGYGLGVDRDGWRHGVLLAGACAIRPRRSAPNGPDGLRARLCRLAAGHCTGRNGRPRCLLAIQDRVRGSAPIWSVHQPQSFRHVGDHGAAPVPRVHRRALRDQEHTTPVRERTFPVRARDRSARGLADGGRGDDAPRAAAIAVAIGRARARRVRSRDLHALPAPPRSPAPPACHGGCRDRGGLRARVGRHPGARASAWPAPRRAWPTA